MPGYEDWLDILSREEGTGEHGYYGIYRDSEGYPTTGHGVRLTEDESRLFGGVGSQAPKDWVDSQSRTRQTGAWENANNYMAESNMPDDPGGRSALASMFDQLGPKWHGEHTKTDK